MNQQSERVEPGTGDGVNVPFDGAKVSFWSRLWRNIAPGNTTKRWDRLPEGSQQDAMGYNVRGGL